MQLLCPILTYLQFLVGCDPVSPDSQHTNNIVFMWKELCLLRLVLFLQSYYKRFKTNFYFSFFQESSFKFKLDTQYGAGEKHTFVSVRSKWKQTVRQKSVFTSTVYDYIHSQSSCLLQNHWQQVWWAVLHWNNPGFIQKGTAMSFWFVIHLNVVKFVILLKTFHQTLTEVVVFAVFNISHMVAAGFRHVCYSISILHW